MTAPRSSSRPVTLALGANTTAVYAPGINDRLPQIDERLAEPETHMQVVDGITIKMMGANPPHATQHIAVANLLHSCVAPGYVSAIDLLTRVDEDNDLAPDVSVFPEAPDPITGKRALEEITFEVLGAETVEHVTRKAHKSVARGVRRVFYVRSDNHDVFEWNHDRKRWSPLADTAAITDRCFRVPLPVRAFASKLMADCAIAQSLLKANNPVITEALVQREQVGRNEGLRDGRSEGLRPLERMIARKLGRALTTTEHDALLRRFETLGAESVGDAVLDHDAPMLAAWLAGVDVS
jgi:hypothetical protein